MTPRFALEARPEGLYLPALDLFLDPRVPVKRAFVSHAHGDHLGALGSPELFASPETLALARVRAAEGTEASFAEAALTKPLPWDGHVDVQTDEGTARISLAPAGHLLGAAQLVVDHPRGRLVYTGDYQPGAGATHPAAARVPCDELIVESTFALPIFRFPDRAATRDAIVQFCKATLNAEETPVLLAYALGKSQELVSALLAAELPVVVHGAAMRMCAAYESLGVDQGVANGKLRAYADETSGTKKKDRLQAVLVTPPRTRQQPMVKNRKNARIAYISGWALLDSAVERHRADRGFALSDHADHDELMDLVTRSGASHVWTVHGDAVDFATMLQERGAAATAIDSAAIDAAEERA